MCCIVCEPIMNAVYDAVCEPIRNAVCEPNGNSLCDTVYDPIII